MTISFSADFLNSVLLRNLNNTSKALSTNLQRLSSGIRVNSAVEGSVELQLADKLSAQIRGMAVAKKNSNDGVSLTQVAEAALNETANALQSIREFAVEAYVSTLSSSDRANLQTEVNSMLSEISRIATQVEFNNMRVLAGSFTDMQFMIGANTTNTLSITFSGASYSGLGLDTNSGINVSTMNAASVTIVNVDTALERVANIRGQIGGAQSRFASVINQIDASTIALSSARSNTLDADVAKETASMTKNAILQQAGVAVMAQANLQPKLMLQLLKTETG